MIEITDIDVVKLKEAALSLAELYKRFGYDTYVRDAEILRNLVTVIETLDGMVGDLRDEIAELKEQVSELNASRTAIALDVIFGEED